MQGDSFFANAQHYDPLSGNWINDRVQRIAEAVVAFHPELRLMWIPPNERPEGAKPYGVWHFPQNSHPYCIMLLDEAELDHRVIAQLATSQSATLDERLTALRESKEMLDRYEEQERRGALLEFAAALWKTPKHTYRHDGKVYQL